MIINIVFIIGYYYVMIESILKYVCRMSKDINSVLNEMWNLIFLIDVILNF